MGWLTRFLVHEKDLMHLALEAELLAARTELSRMSNELESKVAELETLRAGSCPRCTALEEEHAGRIADLQLELRRAEGAAERGARDLFHERQRAEGLDDKLSALQETVQELQDKLAEAEAAAEARVAIPSTAGGGYLSLELLLWSSVGAGAVAALACYYFRAHHQPH